MEPNNEGVERMRLRKVQDDGGFTLIELLVVIVILGLLSVVVVFAVRGTGDKGRAAALSIDVRTMRTAQEAYCAKEGVYAASETDLVNDKFLSEGSTLHDTKRFSPGPCGNTSMLITCDPSQPTCGTDGSTPDGSLVSPTGAWKRTGDLPTGAAGTTLITMSNGKVLSWGLPSGIPPTCPAPGDPACFGTVASQTYGNWAPGPIAIYDPASATWSAAPALPGRPAWDPLYTATMTNITGSAAECGTNCGKVLVQADVGPYTTPRLVAPDYRNNDFFLFDPGSLTWTAVNPPSSILTGHGTKLTQIRCGSRPVGSDCGKVMVAGYATDTNGSQASPSTRDYNAPEYQVALFDPTNGSWATTASPRRRIANNGAFDPTYGTTAGSGVITPMTFTVTDAAGGFRPDDVGKPIAALTISSGGSINSSTFITAVSGCTGNSCTTATMNKMSTNCCSATAEVTKSDQIFIIGTDLGGSYSALGASPGKAAGRVVIWGAPAGASSIYDPVTHAWTLPTQTNLTTPPGRTFTSATVGTGTTFNQRTLTQATGTPTPFYSGDVGSLVTGTGITPGTRIAKVNAPKAIILTQAPTPGTITNFTVTKDQPLLGQLPSFTCGTPDLLLPAAPNNSGTLVLANGKVLSLATAFGCSSMALASSNSSIFDPSTDTWSAAPVNCNCLSAAPGAVLLGPAAGSKPFMVYAADQTSVGAVPASDLGAADGSSWTAVAPPIFDRRTRNFDGSPRVGSPVPGMALLQNGQVLIAGGTKCANAGCTGAAVPQADTWLYTPPIP
jgi:prepilin-type N-terminal cleavage/methylation domain-containing protein